VFRHITCILSDHPNTNLHHTMQISILDNVQKCIFHFMKTHERLDKYNSIWLSVPAYHNLTPKNQSYEKDSQWHGKEMKEMSRYLLGVVTQSLRGGSPTQHPIFNRAIQCTRAVLVFSMYARYRSHNDATLSSMEEALLLYSGVCSSSGVCAGVCEGVSIVSCDETCRINIRSIDD
jgi:hypothetical protein